MVIYQLEDILMRRYNTYRHAAFMPKFRVCSDHVVGFVTIQGGHCCEVVRFQTVKAALELIRERPIRFSRISPCIVILAHFGSNTDWQTRPSVIALRVVAKEHAVCVRDDVAHQL